MSFSILTFWKQILLGKIGNKLNFDIDMVSFGSCLTKGFSSWWNWQNCLKATSKLEIGHNLLLEKWFFATWNQSLYRKPFAADQLLPGLTYFFSIPIAPDYFEKLRFKLWWKYLNCQVVWLISLQLFVNVVSACPPIIPRYWNFIFLADFF